MVFDIEENFLDDKSNGFQLESKISRRLGKVVHGIGSSNTLSCVTGSKLIKVNEDG
jgi:hypothetical protein